MFDIRDHGGNFGDGNGGKLNIYTQLAEPAKKEGIWVKTEQKYSKIVNDLELWFSNAWNDETLKTYAPIPRTFLKGDCASVGTDIYLPAGCDNTSTDHSNSLFHKYNTLTNEWTQLSSTPASVMYHQTVSIGNFVYFIGGITSTGDLGTTMYKYDTVNNTWTKLTNIPFTCRLHCANAVGSNIYVTGGNGSSGTEKMHYKYDTLTDAWTKLTDVPIGITSASSDVVGTKIYYFGGIGSSSSFNATYSYDTLTNTWTKLTNVPYNHYNGSCSAVGTDIYLTGSSYYVDTSDKSHAKGFCKYSTLTDTWTKLDDLSTMTYYHCSCVVNGNMYILGGYYNPTKVRAFNSTSKIYEDRTLVLYKTNSYLGVYMVELITPQKGYTGVNTRILSGFDNVYMYLNGTLQQNLETYYGDGTKWVKFKGGV